MSEIIPNPERGREVFSLDRTYVFHSWSAQGQISPLPVAGGKGAYFWDFDGKKYLDFSCQLVFTNIGFQHPKVIDAIKKQADVLATVAPQVANDVRSEAAKRIVELAGSKFAKVFFTNGGADANENAIKLARGYTKRHKILTRYRSYHGASAGAMAATGDPRRVAWEPNLMTGVVHFLDPYRYRSTFHRTNPNISEADFAQDYVNHLEEIILYEGPESIAGILMESVTGTNGIIIPPEGYMQGVRKLCDKYGIVMIADEVMSGFGRTGKWFAIENWNVVPDMITMAKGLTSAYAPLGAVAMKPEIAAAFDEHAFESGLTYTSHPISLAAAVANIQAMREDKVVEHAAGMGAVLRRMLSDLGEAHPSVGEVRSIGLFGIIELVKDRKTKEPVAPWNGSSPEMVALRKYCMDHGLFLYTHWHTILIIPPLIISEKELKEGFDVLDEALKITDRTVGG